MMHQNSNTEKHTHTYTIIIQLLRYKRNEKSNKFLATWFSQSYCGKYIVYWKHERLL